jgi:hypothetical protein
MMLPKLCLISLVVLLACGSVDPPAATCTSNDVCPASAPFCVSGACVAACSGDATCTDPGLPICAASGACVACVEDEDCPAGSPVCTAENTCVGCSGDAECPDGVCVEATGACVAEADVAYVAENGADAGDCPRATPCGSIGYALDQLGTRKVVHVLGASLFANATVTVKLGTGLVIDGEDTMLGTGPGVVLSVQEAAQATVEGFRFSIIESPPGSAVTPTVVASGGAKLVLHDVRMDGSGGTAVLADSDAELTVQHSSIGNSVSSDTNANTLSCNSATLIVQDNVLETTIVGDGSVGCKTTVRRNRFESSRDGSVHQQGGLLIMENNLIVHREMFNDSISVSQLQPGSTIRFNTVANKTALPSDGAALSCDGSATVTSNIFAYDSGHPITGQGCEVRYSVFDDAVLSAAGTGNQTVAITSIFVDRVNDDYHLKSGSAAIGGAEPGLSQVSDDFEGHARPLPAGTAADCGAFEAP